MKSYTDRQWASHKKRERYTMWVYSQESISLYFVCGSLPICIYHKKRKRLRSEATDEIDRRSMSTDGTLPIYDAQVGE